MGDPAVFSIQHFCLHDGPGTRSVIFFKGCPLRCVWCQNPESWSPQVEVGFKAHLCLNCQSCVVSCGTGALATQYRREHSQCALCLKCSQACPADAMVTFGQRYSVDEIVARLQPEFPYYKNSGGGVTFSGGEPTQHAAFVLQLAQKLKQHGIHLALETCGYFDLSSQAVASLLASVDVVLFDIKIHEDQASQKWCGQGSQLIRQNLERLAGEWGTGRIWPRLPLIPGMTDGQDNLGQWARLLRQLGFTSVTLVPYHSMGSTKRGWLGLESAPMIEQPGETALLLAREIFGAQGIATCAPGEEVTS